MRFSQSSPCDVIFFSLCNVHTIPILSEWKNGRNFKTTFTKPLFAAVAKLRLEEGREGEKHTSFGGQS